MMKFVLLLSAKEDLVRIRQYIQQDSPAAAQSMANRIKQSLLLLTEQPHIGHSTDDDDVLEWHVRGLPYSIPYRIINNQIQILMAFHEAQQRPDSWFDH